MCSLWWNPVTAQYSFFYFLVMLELFCHLFGGPSEMGGTWSQHYFEALLVEGSQGNPQHLKLWLKVKRLAQGQGRGKHCSFSFPTWEKLRPSITKYFKDINCINNWRYREYAVCSCEFLLEVNKHITTFNMGTAGGGDWTAKHWRQPALSYVTIDSLLVWH